MTCCLETITLSPTPPHAPFTQTVSTNTADPSGWMYTLVGVDEEGPNDGWETLRPTDVSALWAPQTLQIQYAGCFHDPCFNTSGGSSSGSGYEQFEGLILATTTTTISSAATTTVIPSASPVAYAASVQPASTSATSGENQSISSKLGALAPSETSHSTLGASDSKSLTPESSPSSRTTTDKDTDTQNSTTEHDAESSDSPSVGAVSMDTKTSSPQVTTAKSPLHTIVTIGSAVITANTASEYVLQDQTLSLGSEMIISGTTVANIGGYIYQGPFNTAITIRSSVVTGDSASDYVLLGQTLSPGSEMVISGTTIADVGGYIYQGFGGGASTSMAELVTFVSVETSDAASTGTTSERPQGASTVVFTQTSASGLSAPTSDAVSVESAGLLLAFILLITL